MCWAEQSRSKRLLGMSSQRNAAKARAARDAQCLRYQRSLGHTRTDNVPSYLLTATNPPGLGMLDPGVEVEVPKWPTCCHDRTRRIPAIDSDSSLPCRSPHDPGIRLTGHDPKITVWHRESALYGDFRTHCKLENGRRIHSHKRITEHAYIRAYYSTIRGCLNDVCPSSKRSLIFQTPHRIVE